jgi:hypothetical protein
MVENKPPRLRPFGWWRLALLVLMIAISIESFRLWMKAPPLKSPSQSSATAPIDAKPSVGSENTSENTSENISESTSESTSQTDSEPAVEAVPVSLATELETSVKKLATEIGERNLEHHAALNRSADWIQSELESFGYTVTRQTFEVSGLACHNLSAQIVGSKQPDEIVIIGAHYDSVSGSPGANDNGSGTAATLALARKFAKSEPARTLRFVFFTNEEPPYFQTEKKMGSLVYARQCRKDNEDIRGVISLETIGYYSDEPNSQHYPPPLHLMYPDTGNFIGFVSNLDSRKLLTQVVKTFRKDSDFPSEFATLPAAVEGVGWSDHWSFWQADYSGIMVTDTAPFRYPHYHLKTDTPDKIDFEKMATVVEGLIPVIEDLAM